MAMEDGTVGELLRRHLCSSLWPAGSLGASGRFWSSTPDSTSPRPPEESRAKAGVPAGRVPHGSSSSSSTAVMRDAGMLFRLYLRMCICFGMGQGAVITTVTYATTFLSRVGCAPGERERKGGSRLEAQIGGTDS